MVWINQSLPQGVGNRFCDGVNVQLLHQAGTVFVHGFGFDGHDLDNLLIGIASDNHVQNSSLSIGQRLTDAKRFDHSDN